MLSFGNTKLLHIDLNFSHNGAKVWIEKTDAGKFRFTIEGWNDVGESDTPRDAKIAATSIVDNWIQPTENSRINKPRIARR